MTVQYMPLEVSHWKVITQQQLGKKKDKTECKVQTIAEPETHKPAGLHLTWQIIIKTGCGTYVDCLASQTFICEQIETVTTDDLKELFDFSQKQVKEMLIEKGKEEGCRLLTMKPSMINESAQLIQILHMMKQSA